MDRCSELGLLSVALMCLPQAGAGNGRVCLKYQDGAYTQHDDAGKIYIVL